MSDSKKIIKNSIFLFIRLILTTFISFFSTRIILDRLGVVDYGIYNVIGGVVVLFTFINNSMTSSTQRNLTHELVVGNLKSQITLFNASLRIHLVIAILGIILLETFGQYFVYNVLNIPQDKMFAAQVVYQCTIIMFFLNIIMVPYQAAINAHEHMHIIATRGVIESIAKLIISLSLGLYLYKLEMYSILLLLLTLILSGSYYLYCRKRYEECQVLNISIDKNIYKSLTSFAGWTLFGAISSLVRKQGSTILINIFFGAASNAAFAIASQISNQLNILSETLLKAIAPQIVKNYSKNNLKEMIKMMCIASKYSYFLFIIVAIPFYIDLEYILKLWLKNVPNYTLVFSKLIIFNVLLDVLLGPMITSIQATGKIKNYQLTSGLVFILNLPTAYVFLNLGFDPQVVIFSNIFFTILIGIIRLYFLNKLIGLSIINWLRDVLFKAVFITIIAYLSLYYLKNIVNEGLIRLFILSILSIILCSFLIFIFGMKREERNYLINFLQLKFNKYGIKKN